jgi:hypothetical protein
LNNINFEYGINFDKEDGEVMDAVIPFEYCAAHFGDKGWGNSNWNDIQGRVYVTNLTLDEVSEKIEKNGLDKASSLFEKASVESSAYKDWEHKSLNLLDAPTHFILVKEMCFYYRMFDNKTVVFIFLDAERHEKEIGFILSSFNWRNKDKKTPKKIKNTMNDSGFNS